MSTAERIEEERHPLNPMDVIVRDQSSPRSLGPSLQNRALFILFLELTLNNTDKLPSPTGWCTLQVWPLPTVGSKRRVVPVWERGGSIPQGPDGASTAGHIPGGSQLPALTPEVGHGEKASGQEDLREGRGHSSERTVF